MMPKDRPDRPAHADGHRRSAAWPPAAPIRLLKLAVSPLALILAFAVGCGRHPARLSGAVTLDGKPLTNGVIMLSPARTGPSAYGAIGSDGRYELKTGSEHGLEPGDYVVTVAANESGPEAPDPRSGAAPAIRPLMTPQRYADVATSPLRITVKPGNQTLAIELTTDPQPSSHDPPGAEP